MFCVFWCGYWLLAALPVVSYALNVWLLSVPRDSLRGWGKGWKHGSSCLSWAVGSAPFQAQPACLLNSALSYTLSYYHIIESKSRGQRNCGWMEQPASTWTFVSSESHKWLPPQHNKNNSSPPGPILGEEM